MLTAHAYWRLEWLCHRTPNEVSAMGLIQPSEQGILIEDFILVKQEVGPAHVSLDMNWWADKVVELYDQYGIEPWRTSAWAHTHPSGVNRPSGTDEATMEESFGGSDFFVMLILTQDGHFYARMDFDHDFGNGTKQRLSMPCNVEIDWNNAGAEPITEETIMRWEAEFQALVHEIPNAWSFFEDGPNEGVKRRKSSWLPRPKTNGQTLGGNAERKEIEQYVQACRNTGFDPNDPDNFEDYFGFEPQPEH